MVELEIQHGRHIDRNSTEVEGSRLLNTQAETSHGPQGEGLRLKSAPKINRVDSLWRDPILEFSGCISITLLVAVAVSPSI